MGVYIHVHTYTHVYIHGAPANFTTACDSPCHARYGLSQVSLCTDMGSLSVREEKRERERERARYGGRGRGKQEEPRTPLARGVGFGIWVQ